MVYTRDTIQSEVEEYSCPNDIECIFINLSFRKCKVLFCQTYHPPSQNDECYLSYFDKTLDTYSTYK